MNVRGFLGGHPIAVIVRLALVCLFVGLLLSLFGITPRNFFQTIDDLVRRIYDLGFGAVEWLLEYMLLGAMLVIPVWLILRLLNMRGVKTD